MRRFLTATLALSALAGLATAAHADTCTIVALRDVPYLAPGTNAPLGDGQVFKKGSTDDAQFYDNGVFSAEGGDAVPRYVIVAGKRVEAVRLVDCRFSARYPTALVPTRRRAAN